MSVRRPASRSEDQRGQTSLFIVGLAVVLMMATAVGVDSSAAFLYRQRLDSIADGAALAGADAGANGWEVYGDGLSGDRLDVVRHEAAAGVHDYLVSLHAYVEHPGLTSHVEVVDGAVRVTIRAPMSLPLTLPGSQDGVLVAAVGSAAVTTE